MKQPQHIAIIMDGNGRWAQSRGHHRVFGHIRGARTAKNIIEHCARLGVPYLTLFAFSTENWFRPLEEVQFLMKLLSRHLRRETRTLMKNNICFRCIGNLERLPESVRAVVEETIELTKDNTGMTVVFALSYGGRQEIKNAMTRIARRIEKGLLKADQIDESLISNELDSSFLPDPDLIIRTSGESRISNFFLWQSAYSELYISPKLWPDFTEQDFDMAVRSFNTRERRFGRVLTALTPPPRVAEPSASP